MSRSEYDKWMMKLFNPPTQAPIGTGLRGWGKQLPPVIEGMCIACGDAVEPYASGAYGGGTMGDACLNQPWSYERSPYDIMVMKNSNAKN